jgi:hypothetical protein
MASKPPDLLCPIQAVSQELFSAYWDRLENGDKYFHTAFSVNHKLHAVWHWDRGVWWTCLPLNQLVHCVVEGLQSMGRLDLLGK